MDPVFASVVLGFFSLAIALVAIVYIQSDVAKRVIDRDDKPYPEKSKQKD